MFTDLFTSGQHIWFLTRGRSFDSRNFWDFYKRINPETSENNRAAFWLGGIEYVNQFATTRPAGTGHTMLYCQKVTENLIIFRCVKFVCMCMYLCMCNNANPFLSAFGPRFIAERGESVSHFILFSTIELIIAERCVFISWGSFQGWV